MPMIEVMASDSKSAIASFSEQKKSQVAWGRVRSLFTVYSLVCRRKEGLATGGPPREPGGWKNGQGMACRLFKAGKKRESVVQALRGARQARFCGGTKIAR
ncbi:hypothetical protein GMST_26050 [Geomonas silvestris]|uniref:Uncharacterized protein n=1 Tax=Geomonas silvestris TaxID=2740184 RepID=A0A6V8MJW2_9BACT|nr:hypothetical protein GMST_26050 [Geomonas silvestris]